MEQAVVNGKEPGIEPAVRDYTVLVTGFGANHNAPYGNATTNPAGMIASSMPLSIPRTHRLNSSGANIRIIDPSASGHGSIPALYSSIRQKIKELHETFLGQVDLFVHLGRGPWSWVTVERRAFREDMSASWSRPGPYYLYKDNEGQNSAVFGPCPWTKVPIGLETSIDIDTVVQDANERLRQQAEQNKPGPDPLEVAPHFEAGSAPCGFAYYESMANRYIQGKPRNVIFCHVPRDTDDENLKRAQDAILSVISAAVRNLVNEEAAVPQDPLQRFGRIKD